jgi:hypothetical protein
VFGTDRNTDLKKATLHDDGNALKTNQTEETDQQVLHAVSTQTSAGIGLIKRAQTSTPGLSTWSTRLSTSRRLLEHGRNRFSFARQAAVPDVLLLPESRA